MTHCPADFVTVRVILQCNRQSSSLTRSRQAYVQLGERDAFVWWQEGVRQRGWDVDSVRGPSSMWENWASTSACRAVWWPSGAVVLGGRAHYVGTAGVFWKVGATLRGVDHRRQLVVRPRSGLITPRQYQSARHLCRASVQCSSAVRRWVSW